MDRDRFSAIAHTGLRFWSPVPAPAFLGCLDAADLTADARLLDIGCGRAEGLCLAAERYGLSGVGVERSARALALARSPACGTATLHETDFDAATFAGPWDAIVCVGSSQAVGGYPALLAFAAAHLAPGGHLLTGELYWRASPAPAYLDFFGCTETDMPWRADLQAQARAAGFSVVTGYDCTVEDWDRYEDAYAANVERHVEQHPDDPDAPAMLARIRPWRAHYLQYGRATLGFGLDLLRRP